MQDNHNRGNNSNDNSGNFNHSSAKPVVQNNGHWQNTPQHYNQLNNNQNSPHHRNYVERVIDYKFIPVMPMNVNQQWYNNSQPAPQPNNYYQPVNTYQQPQQPLLQQFIVPPSAASVGGDLNNYPFQQQPFFESPFNSMPFDNFYPNINMINPMEMGFNNNPNSFMPMYPNSVVNNQLDGFDNYNNFNNNEQMYYNQNQYNQPNWAQQSVNHFQQNTDQVTSQAANQQDLNHNKMSQQLEKYEQRLDNINTKYNQISNQQDSQVFDKKLNDLEEKIIKLKDKLSEADLLEDEIVDDLVKSNNKVVDLHEKTIVDSSLATKEEVKKAKIKKILIVSGLSLLFIAIAIGAYFGYTLWLKDILINKLKWNWLS